MISWQVSIGLAALAAVVLWVAFTLPPAGRARRTHVLLGFGAALLGGAAGWLWNSDYREARASQVAELIADGHYPPETRIEMTLLFFEKYRTLYPDTYARARAYVEGKGCLAPKSTMDEKRVIECMRNQVETSIHFRGLMRAVAPPVPGDQPAH